MARSADTFRLIDRYRSGLDTISRDLLAQMLTEYRRRFDPAHPDETIRALIALLAPLVEAADITAQRLSLAFYATQRRIEIGTARLPAAAVGRDERTRAAMVARLFSIATQTRRAVGDPFARGAQQVTVIAMSEPHDWARVTINELGTADPATSGWRRVTDGSPCGACAAKAGRTYEWGAGFDRHPGCGCTREILYDDVPDNFQPAGVDRLTPRMSPLKRAALRDGDIRPEDLVTVTGSDRVGGHMHETPAKDL